MLEVIVALTILAAGFIGLLAMLSGSVRLSGASRDVGIATVYASQLMEEALLAPNPAEGTESAVIGEKYRWVKKTSLPPAEEKSPFQAVVLEVSILWYDGPRERSVALAATRWDRKDTGG